MDYDKATWGIILAIAAIVLAFPLSLLANLVTPLIREWWAQTTAAGLRALIQATENQLAEAKTHPLVSEAEQMILVSIHMLAKMLGQFIGAFIGFALALLALFWPHFVKLGVILGLLLIVVITSFIAWVQVPISSFLSHRTLAGREKTEGNIERLKAKLTAAQKS